MKTITGKHSQYTTCQDSAFCCQIYSPGKNVYQSKLWPAWPGGLGSRSHGAFVLILPIVVLNKTNQNPPHPGGRDKSDPVGFGHTLERGNRNSIKWCRWETKFNQLQKILMTKTIFRIDSSFWMMKKCADSDKLIHQSICSLYINIILTTLPANMILLCCACLQYHYVSTKLQLVIMGVTL